MRARAICLPVGGGIVGLHSALSRRSALAKALLLFFSLQLPTDTGIQPTDTAGTHTGHITRRQTNTYG